jgi:hypothetical protein
MIGIIIIIIIIATTEHDNRIIITPVCSHDVLGSIPGQAVLTEISLLRQALQANAAPRDQFVME